MNDFFKVLFHTHTHSHAHIPTDGADNAVVIACVRFIALKQIKCSSLCSDLLVAGHVRDTLFEAL